MKQCKIIIGVHMKTQSCPSYNPQKATIKFIYQDRFVGFRDRYLAVPK